MEYKVSCATWHHQHSNVTSVFFYRTQNGTFYSQYSILNNRHFARSDQLPLQVATRFNVIIVKWGQRPSVFGWLKCSKVPKRTKDSNGIRCSGHKLARVRWCISASCGRVAIALCCWRVSMRANWRCFVPGSAKLGAVLVWRCLALQDQSFWQIGEFLFLV